MKFTILGGAGFIGTHLAAEARRRGAEVAAPDRDGWDEALTDNPGHVIYSAGTTADFRTRSFDTVRAHVCRLVEVLERGSFDSLLYLSSTRIYGGSASGSEDSVFTVDPKSASDLFNVSKLMGESLCLARSGPIRIARPSNVYGPDWLSENFLMSITRSAAEHGEVVFRTAPESSKDYISISDAAPLLLDLAERGTQSIYNVASGISTSNEMIAAVLRRVGIRVRYDDKAPIVGFPIIDISRVRDEFAFAPRSVVDDLPSLIESYRSRKTDDRKCS
jgi:nucleoside-diphosphate-sugar epimerase